MEVGGIRVKSGPDGGVVIHGPADLIDLFDCSRDLVDLRQALPLIVRARLRIADGLGQHLAQFRLRLRRFPREVGFLPGNHNRHMGMQGSKVNAAGDRKTGQQPFDDGCLRVTSYATLLGAFLTRERQRPFIVLRMVPFRDGNGAVRALHCAQQGGRPCAGKHLTI